MRITRTVAVAASTLLVPVAIATAAASPSGDYKGNMKFNDGYRSSTFALKATFKAGKLSRLYGQGPELPFVKKLSNGEFCGAVNIYDTADASDKGKYRATISGGPTSGGNFSYVLTGKFHDVTTIKGKVVSATKINASIRFYMGHEPDVHGKGHSSHCDSGFLPVTLTR